MMPRRFIVLALIFFFLGLGVLYNGWNRVPFRDHEPGISPKHGHSSMHIRDVAPQEKVVVLYQVFLHA